MTKSNRVQHASDAYALVEIICNEIIAVMDECPQIHQEDFNFYILRTQLLLPLATYLTKQIALGKSHPVATHYTKPIFISGIPGIGKTTLLMVLDEALSRLNGSCRDIVVTGTVRGYFADKVPLQVVPLSLFGNLTGVLSVRDWSNILRHWTFDEVKADYSHLALLDLIHHLKGKVVIMDEAELEGYVYLCELLAKHGVLVVLSTNLTANHLHLASEQVEFITVQGSDHRHGDISKVCLPNVPHVLFDRYAHISACNEIVHGMKLSREKIGSKTLVYFDRNNLEKQPLMKDDFASCYKATSAEAVLLDAVPFFTDIAPEAVDLTFLGYLSRFVNFVDAVHDCRLPLLIRGLHKQILTNLTAGSQLQTVLIGYDQRTGTHYGQAAWIEWMRCLSRLRSREELNQLAFEYGDSR